MIIEAREDVVSLSGELEHNYWPAIQAAANLLLRKHPNGILIDASEVTYCCEEGVYTFVDAMDYIERHHARIVVCHPPDEVKRVIKQTPGARSQLALADTCEHGRASLELASSNRYLAKSKADSATNEVRPRLVMIPLFGQSQGIKDTIGLALKMASVRIGKGEQTKGQMIAPVLHLIYLLEVPRSMPLSATMTEEEETAKIALNEAASIAQAAGIESRTSVARTRDMGEEIAVQATNIRAEMIFLTVPSLSQSNSNENLDQIVDLVFQKARCEVVLKNWSTVN